MVSCQTGLLYRHDTTSVQTISPKEGGTVVRESIKSTLERRGKCDIKTCQNDCRPIRTRTVFSYLVVARPCQKPTGRSWGGRISHRKWNNGSHWPVRPIWPLIPFPVRRSASPPDSYSQSQLPSLMIQLDSPVFQITARRTIARDRDRSMSLIYAAAEPNRR